MILLVRRAYATSWVHTLMGLSTRFHKILAFKVTLNAQNFILNYLRLECLQNYIFYSFTLVSNSPRALANLCQLYVFNPNEINESVKKYECKFRIVMLWP